MIECWEKKKQKKNLEEEEPIKEKEIPKAANEHAKNKQARTLLIQSKPEQTWRMENSFHR